MIEIKLKRKYLAQGAGKKQKGGHNNQGTKHANRREPLKGEREAAQRVTAANRKVLVLLANGKKTFMRQAEWDTHSH